MKSIFQVGASYLSSLSYITRPQVAKYVVYTALISLLVGGVLFYTIWQSSDDISRWLVSVLPFGDYSSWAETPLTYATGIILGVVVLFLFKYMVMLTASPFLGAISEWVENSLTGQSTGVDSIADMVRIMFSRNLALIGRLITRELLWTIPLLLLMLIPGLNLLAAVLLFIVQAYYAGIGAIDPYQEGRLNLRDTIRYARSRRLGMIALGAGFLGLLFIPIIGVLLAPILSTIAGTIVGVKWDNR